jgi:SAM-dependent methyltransferase
MTSHSERWFGATWPVVRGALPPPPARVVELGCGPRGGFVPMLAADGYDAVGVDPEAPDGPQYLRGAFEDADLPDGVEAVVAAVSLHHVADPAEVFDRIGRLLGPEGRVVVVEWDWAAFDEPTSEWCFARLDPSGEETWLHRRRDAWLGSGEPWRDYFAAWAREHGLHDASDLLRLLSERFEQVHLEREPYFFPALATTEEDERAAIRNGLIRPGRVDYVGRVASVHGSFPRLRSG